MGGTVGVVAWVVAAAFSFYLTSRAAPGRERTGRCLVGAASVLIAVLLALPAWSPGGFPAIADLVFMFVAGFLLLLGLILAFPAGGLRPADEPGGGKDARPADSESDSDAE